MISIAKKHGFCNGVSAAHSRALEVLQQSVGKKYLYGDLVNNSGVMQDLLARGFSVLSDEQASTQLSPDDTVVIRAHGVPRSVHEAFAHAKVVDCTCPKVEKIHKIVAGARDKTVVVVGRRGHPEVVGIVGWCAGCVFVVECADDIAAIDPAADVVVVGQTTCGRDQYADLSEKIRTHAKRSRIHNTICGECSANQTSSAKLAESCDAFIVVGDEKSSNATKLYEICAAVCTQTLFISDMSELSGHSGLLDTTIRIGIAGSMSTPKTAVRDVFDYLTFARFLHSVRREIDGAFESILHTALGDVCDTPEVSSIISTFCEQNKGGKRLRAALIKLGAKLGAQLVTRGGKKATRIAPYLVPAVAYEIFQTAILIHDDIIDNASSRRGKPTIHTDSQDPHFGISRAICAGDFGFFLVNLLLSKNLVGLNAMQTLRTFAHIQMRTIQGEILDVGLPHRDMDIATDYDEYMQAVYRIYENKTAWYTIAGPLLIGAGLLPCPADALDMIEKIGMPLGIAFQIKDDLLGIYANEAITGKTALSDIAEKKHTLLYGHAMKHASGEQRKRLDAAYGNAKSTPDDLHTVREIFTATGAQTHAEAEIKRLCDTSLEHISAFVDAHTPSDAAPKQVRLIEECASLLRGLVCYILARSH